MLPDAASDGTLPDRHVLHGCVSFYMGRPNIPTTEAEGVPFLRMRSVRMAEHEHPVRRRVALKLIKPGMDSKGAASCS